MTDLGVAGRTWTLTVLLWQSTSVDRSSAGVKASNGSSHALLWQNDTLIDLGTLGGDYSVAVAINPRGDVVGEGETTSGENHAVLWTNSRRGPRSK